jgi:predicted lipoprotein with Yx(FWY)xxD motif
LVFATATVLTLGVAQAAEPAMVGKTDKGPALVDSKGMTLYTFDKDSEGKSVCYDKCAANWPPLTAPAGAKADGKYSVIDRTDGTKQWAYNGQPLYTWVKDAKPGDATGDGVGGVWYLAKP